jgi:hypothetical protein
MKYKFKLMIVISALMCLLLTAVAPAAIEAGCQKQIYIDGQLLGDGTAAAGLTKPYEDITIGAENDKYYPYNAFVGMIDEFSIYSGVLDAATIEAHYDAADVNYVDVVGLSEPLLWLRFEDASSAHEDTAANSGSVGIDGQYWNQGGVLSDPCLVTGRVGNAVELFGAVDGNGTTVAVWDGNGDFSTQQLGDVTIELWFKTTNVSDYPRLFQHNQGSEGGYGLVISSPNEVGVIGGGETHYFATDAIASNLADGAWHHVVITYDSTYALPETGTYAEEVAENTPFIWIRFDDEVPTDSSGNDNLAVYGSNVELVDMVGGLGLTAIQDANYERYGTYVAAVANKYVPIRWNELGDYSLTYTNDMTIEFWYKSLPPDVNNQPGQYAMMCQQIGRADNEPNAPAIGTSRDGENPAQIRVFGGLPDPTGSPGENILYTGFEPYDEQWHHIVVIYQQEYEGNPDTMHMKVYFDGGSLGGADQSGVVEKTISGPGAGFQEQGLQLLNHMLLGAHNDRGWPYSSVPGYFDEFAIYDYPLDANSVLDHWAAWQITDCATLQERGPLPTGAIADRDGNCVIDFVDFALFAKDWFLSFDTDNPTIPDGQ